MARLKVLNPVAQSLETSVEPAPRIPDLSGKRIGLYWNMKAGGDVALRRVEELLLERYPDVQLRHYLADVGAGMRHGSDTLVGRVARECDAVIGTSAD